MYGPHSYNGKVFCDHGCGCWKEGSRLGGPAGLDPGPDGECPGNPITGARGNDKEAVIRRRIEALVAHIKRLEQEVLRQQ